MLQLLYCRHSPQSRCQSLQQDAERTDLRIGNEQVGFGVAQNAPLTPQMLFDLSATKWRIDGHWNGTSREHRKERDEEVSTGRQHDDDAIARPGTSIEKARSALA